MAGAGVVAGDGAVFGAGVAEGDGVLAGAGVVAGDGENSNGTDWNGTGREGRATRVPPVRDRRAEIESES